MSKKNKTPLNILIEATKLYFSNFDKFVKYMTFPVLGQIGGLSLVFFLIYFYAKNMPTLIQKIPALNNFSVLLGIVILLILPGLAIFVKSFWEYLVAYGAINSMFENMLKSGKVYDFDAHTELIKRRVIPFVGLWILFGVFSTLAICPLFWVLCAVFAIFFVLVFQVFVFEPDQSPIGCARRSLELVKGAFSSTLLLFVLVGSITYILVPNLVNLFFNYTNLTLFFANLLTPFIQTLPIVEVNNMLAYAYIPALKVQDIANFTVSTCVAQVFIQYTLPLRSILWGLWYKHLNGGKLGGAVEKNKSSRNKKSYKRASEKLMENSHKKFASKKLDRNLLKRAMEKDDE